MSEKFTDFSENPREKELKANLVALAQMNYGKEVETLIDAEWVHLLREVNAGVQPAERINRKNFEK